MNLSEKPAPIPVFFQGSETPCGYACGICKHLWDGDASATFAHRCCPPHRCDHPGCDKARLGHYVYCTEHLLESQAARLAEKVSKAKRVAANEWAGPVWDESADDRGWHQSVDDLVDGYDGGGSEGPAWVWGCEELSRGLDASDIIESATEECGESARDNAMVGVDDLQAALDAWSKENPIRWWEPTDVVVVIDPARFAEEFPGMTDPSVQ